MKKLSIILLASSLLGLNITAQSQLNLLSGEPAIVYSLPQTQLEFEIEFERVVAEPGIFYQYSERYLATKDIITESSVGFQLLGIKMNTLTVADANRTFIIQPIAKSGHKNLVLNDKGILLGVNINPSDNQEIIKKKIIERREVREVGSDLLPLTEEYMLAGASAKMAEGAAKQIYHIRESRLNLLTGEMERQPSDGKSLQIMLDGLNQQEAELSSLFIGKRTKQIMRKKIIFTPDSINEKEVLFRFSAKRGVVDANDLSGNPYYLELQADTIKVTQSLTPADISKVSINTVIPVNATVSITDGIKAMLTEKLELPQLGTVVPLPDTFFKGNPVKVRLNPSTGRLISIENK